MANNSFAASWGNKGDALDDKGKYADAIQACDRVIKIDPNLADEWNNKGEAFKALGRTAEANAAYAKAKELEYKG